MIELAEVSKTYNAGRANAFKALIDVNLCLDHGRITVFKGPSGSGKTTLLGIIGGMTRPTSGRILMDGREMTSLPERFLARNRRQAFGFIFQNYQLIRGISAIENVMLPAYPLGWRPKVLRQKAQDLLERLRLAGKASMPVEFLSGGEQQRIAIARALINDPAVIVADEPTAHLDTALSQEFLAVAADLRAAGKTVLIASHDRRMYAAEEMDRVVSLRDGMVVNGDGSQGASLQ